MDTMPSLTASCRHMALTLLLRSGGLDPVPQVECEAPRLVLGRASGCDLQLPDPSVSRHHASLRQRGSDYLLVDEGSENGTFIGRERLISYTPHAIRPGDLIRLGRVWVQVVANPTQATAPSAARELARRLVSGSLASAGLPSELNLRLTKGPSAGKQLALIEPETPYVIGRSRSAGLTLKDETLPTRALEVQRQGGQLRIKSLDPEVQATLGGKLLETGRFTPWRSRDELQVGDHRICFEDPVAECLVQIEGSKTEPLSQTENLEPPEGCKLPRLPSVGTQTSKGSESQSTTAPDSHQSPPRKRLRRRWAKNAGSERWTGSDSVIFSMAMCVLGASLWAIHWVVSFDPV